LDGSDVALVDDNNILVLGLNAGASKANNISVTIPDDTAPGSYYIIAKADGVNLITEVAENNNAMSKAISVP
jgi:subtilase family serine protease